MVTLTMNKFDINKQIVKAMVHYNLKLQNMQQVLDRQFKHNKKAKACRAEIVEWRQEHQKYIAFANRVFGYGGPTMSAIVNHGKQEWVYELLVDPTDTMDAYSMHFFKRYAERTNQPFLFPAIVCKYKMRNRHRFRIYQSDNMENMVYATNEGIELCRLDEERGITKFCTFVSISMFKTSQLEAWKIAQQKLEEADDISNGHGSLSQKAKMLLEWSSSGTDLMELAIDIYKKFSHEMAEDGDGN